MPEPDSPRMQRTSPGSRVNDTEFTARTVASRLSKRTVTSSARTMGPPAAAARAEPAVEEGVGAVIGRSDLAPKAGEAALAPAAVETFGQRIDVARQLA